MLSLAASVGSADEVTLLVTPDRFTIQPGATDNFAYTITNNSASDTVVGENINQDLVQNATVDYSPFDYPMLDPAPNSATGTLATLMADPNAPVGSVNHRRVAVPASDGPRTRLFLALRNGIVRTFRDKKQMDVQEADIHGLTCCAASFRPCGKTRRNSVGSWS
jgi:hypothetical protein